jgi:hypothetical protein
MIIINEEDEMINLELIILIVTIGAFILYTIITYNEKLVIEKRKPFISANDSNKLELFYRYLIIILSLAIIYVNVRNKNIAIKNNKYNNLFDLQIYSAVIALIAFSIALYVSVKDIESESSPISGYENPVV